MSVVAGTVGEAIERHPEAIAGEDVLPHDQLLRFRARGSHPVSIGNAGRCGRGQPLTDPEGMVHHPAAAYPQVGEGVSTGVNSRN